MATQSLTMLPLEPPSMRSRVVISIVVHIVILAGIPLMSKLFYRPKTFVRPGTIQLVRLPPQARPAAAPQTPQAKPPAPTPQTRPPEPKPAQKPEAAKPQQKAPSAPKPPLEPPPDDNSLSELDDILGAVSAPPVDLSALASDFKYPWYTNAIVAKVEQNWKPSVRDPNAFVEVEFTVFRNGTISDVRVRRSSGNSSLDNLAVRAVKLAAPFGALPVGFAEQSLGIGLKLVAIGR